MLDHDHDDHHHDHDHHATDGRPVHPKDRAPVADDPMVLDPIELDGDPEIMVDCLIEEFARMGWGADAIMKLFNDPFYEGPFRAARRYDPVEFRQRVQRVLQRCGTLRVRIVESADDELQSVMPTVRGRSVL